MKPDNHIHADLDFVPAEEQKPQKARTVMMIYRGRMMEGYWVHANQWHSNLDDRFIYNVTHWSEIPTIEERE